LQGALALPGAAPSKNQPRAKRRPGQCLMGGLHPAALVWRERGFSSVATPFGSTSTNQLLRPASATALQALRSGGSQGAAWTG